MKFIKVPIEISLLTEEEISQREDLGLDFEIDVRQGHMYVNTEHIAAFVEMEEYIDIDLSSGQRIAVRLPLDDFLSQLYD